MADLDNKAITPDQAVQLINTGLKKLSEEYLATQTRNGLVPKFTDSGQYILYVSDGTLQWAAATTMADILGDSLPTASATEAGLAPQLSDVATQYLNGKGQWTTPPDNDTTYENASTSRAGLLPMLSGTATQYLNGSGNWTVPTDTKYSVVSKSAAGLCPQLPSDPNVA